MSSAVKREQSKAHAEIIWWLVAYAAATPWVEVNNNGTVRLDDETVLQPDAALRIVVEGEGASRVSKDGYVQGSPELVVEISGSGASFEQSEMRDVYQRCGVQEYLFWHISEHRLEWFELQAGVSRPLEPDAAGILHSRVFPGLHLASDALLAGELSNVADVLQQGVQTRWHESFVQSLGAAQEKSA